MKSDPDLVERHILLVRSGDLDYASHRIESGICLLGGVAIDNDLHAGTGMVRSLHHIVHDGVGGRLEPGGRRHLVCGSEGGLREGWREREKEGLGNKAGGKGDADNEQVHAGKGMDGERIPSYTTKQSILTHLIFITEVELDVFLRPFRKKSKMLCRLSKQPL